MIKASKAGDWTTTPEGRVYVAGIELMPHEYERRLVSKDPGAAAELPQSSGLVVLDTTVTPELTAEGLARDLVRVVQQSRRDAGLDVSDRIDLAVSAPDAVVAAVRAHERFVMGETLAEAVSYGAVVDGFEGTVGEGVEVMVAVTRRP